MATLSISRLHGSFNRSRRSAAIKYVVVHYTGSGGTYAGAARANCQYFGGGDRNASADYFVDDGGVWEYNDPSEGYCTWAVGDGGGRYGITNANSVSVEVCQSGDRPYTEAEIGHLHLLVRHLMARYGVDASHVVRHWDASRKSCPWYYAARAWDWEELRRRVTAPVDEREWDEMATKEEIEQAVWGHDIHGHAASERLYLCNVMDYDTSDPTGRGMNLNDHEHLKWVAKGQAEQNEVLSRMAQVLEGIAGALGVEVPPPPEEGDEEGAAEGDAAGDPAEKVGGTE